MVIRTRCLADDFTYERVARRIKPAHISNNRAQPGSWCISSQGHAGDGDNTRRDRPVDDIADGRGAQAAASPARSVTRNRRTRVKIGSGSVNPRTTNIEPIARAICARELQAAPRIDPDEMPALVDRCWPAVAAEMAAGLRDDDGNIIPHAAAAGIAAWEDWLDDQTPRR